MVNIRCRTCDQGLSLTSDCPSLRLGLGFELVADAVARLDERVPRGFAVDLVAELADEDVDGPVAMALPPAPELLQELVPADDAPALERECIEEPEFGRRQLRALAVHVRLDVHRVDAKLLDLDRLAALLGLLVSAAAGRDPAARDELLHRERLHQIVVRSDLEGVHTVVLGPARADDADRRPAAFGARRFEL